MRSVLALLRAAFLTQSSYRVATLISFVALLASVVPIYFVSGALQPVVQASIRLEGGEYFAFLVVGLAALTLIATAVNAIPAVLAGTLGSGTFESLYVTRTRLPTLLIGMIAFPLAQGALRALLLLGGGLVVGMPMHWSGVPLALLAFGLMTLAYVAIGLVSAALVLVFRTSGPIGTAVVAGSALLGGAYYSTTVVPSWLQDLSGLFPLTYALRATRMLLLSGAPWGEVAGDLGAVALFAVTLLAIGTLAFMAALRHARRSGTLSQY